MILVCEPRTGSTLAANEFGIKPEIFLGWWEIIDDEFIRNQNLKSDISLEIFYEKLQWLWLKRASGEPLGFKIVTHSLTPLMKVELLHYLKDEEIVTIERNPWDACMSFLFQESTKWKVTHNTPHKTIIKENFIAKKEAITRWVEKHYLHEKFIKNCNNVKIIKYEDVYELGKSNNFFKPSNIDYKECMNNYEEAKLFFDEEMKNKCVD